jgi:hypothetical protein
MKNAGEGAVMQASLLCCHCPVVSSSSSLPVPLSLLLCCHHYFITAVATSPHHHWWWLILPVPVLVPSLLPISIPGAVTHGGGLGCKEKMKEMKKSPAICVFKKEMK